MTVSLRALRDRAVEALETLLPESPGVVIALASELPASLRGPAIGYTGENIDIGLRSHLGFSGRAMCLVVEDETLFENQQAHATARGLDEPTPFMIRCAFLETCCHEVGHIVTNRWIPRPGDPGPATPTVTARVEKLCIAGPDRRSAQDQVAPWHNHNGKWVRVYLHLARRLSDALGIGIVPRTDEFHGLTAAWKYQVALGGELTRLAGVALTEIADILPPSAFVSQWQGDVRAWWLGLEHPAELQTTMFLHAFRLFDPK